MAQCRNLYTEAINFAILLNLLIGHSQNSMFASYIGYCLNERIVGIWSGASGLLLPKVDPPTPGCQGHTKMSDYKTCVIKDGIGCEQCINEGHGCKECKVSSQSFSITDGSI